MSAFLVSDNHIDQLITVALHGPRDGKNARNWYQPSLKGTQTWGAESATEAGQMLLNENYNSLDARYPADKDGRHAFTYAGRGPRLTIVEAFKALDCYEYQSCEHDGWEASYARKFCDSLRGNLCSSMAGYDAAPWGIE
jgi:hypothetical protein